MIGRTMAAALAIGAMTAGIAMAQTIGRTITLDGKEFKIGDWGFPYWSGKREIYAAYRHGRRNEISYRATINIAEPGVPEAGWDVTYKDVQGAVSSQACPEEERIIRDMARLAGLSITRIVVGDCKTNFLQGPRNYRTGGVITFTRTTPVIAPVDLRIPSNGNAAPSPQGSVRFAPLGREAATASTRTSPAPEPPPSVPVTSAQQQAELAAREKLNREQAALAAKQLSDNEAAKAAFEAATREREATIARQQAEYQAALAAQQAEAARREAEHAAAMERWRADVAACKAGDASRCQQSQPPR